MTIRTIEVSDTFRVPSIRTYESRQEAEAFIMEAMVRAFGWTQERANAEIPGHDGPFRMDPAMEDTDNWSIRIEDDDAPVVLNVPDGRR